MKKFPRKQKNWLRLAALSLTVLTLVQSCGSKSKNAGNTGTATIYGGTQ